MRQSPANQMVSLTDTTTQNSLMHASNSSNFSKPFGKRPEKLKKGEAIKVAVRVRPLLPHEQYTPEIIYYPESKDPGLEVSGKCD